jgi:hypothetical protein
MTGPFLPRINLISLITKQSSKVILTYALSSLLIDRDNFDFRHFPKHQRETQRQGDRRREVLINISNGGDNRIWRILL